jgi:hypothetical protein
VEETRLKFKLGVHDTYRDVHVAAYRLTAAKGWVMFQTYFELTAVQTLLSLLGAVTDPAGHSPAALFAMAMTEWQRRYARVDLKHCVPAMLNEKLLVPFIGTEQSFDGALSLLQQLRANASYNDCPLPRWRWPLCGT